MNKLARAFSFGVAGFACLVFVTWASQFVQAHYHRRQHILWTPGLLESVCLLAVAVGVIGAWRAWVLRRDMRTPRHLLLAFLTAVFCVLCSIAALVAIVAVVPIYAHPPRP